jgi:hypothetical protein
MPRDKSENVFPLSFRVPEEWVELADEIADAMSNPPVRITRTDVMRTALLRGLQALKADHQSPGKGKGKR